LLSFNNGLVRVGTSGYSFDDWRGTFYPEKIEKTKMLDYYVGHFDTVEINSTYYGIPHPRVFEAMAKKTPEGFDFMVKAHQSLTHKRDQLEQETPKYLEAIKPLIESGKFRGVLAQFPWSFPCVPIHLDHLRKCRESLGDLSLFIEFRHSSWIRQSTFDLLRSLEIGYVSVDEPQLDKMIEPLAVATTAVGYVRFHGRNSKDWYSGSGSERYNYSYSMDELTEWVEKIRRLQKDTEVIYLFFNNCHLGQAVFNAKQIMEILDVRRN
jgi:uncharacterized protein YecE (DUF72 family)